MLAVAVCLGALAVFLASWLVAATAVHGEAQWFLGIATTFAMIAAGCGCLAGIALAALLMLIRRAFSARLLVAMAAATAPPLWLAAKLL